MNRLDRFIAAKKANIKLLSKKGGIKSEFFSLESEREMLNKALLKRDQRDIFN